MLKRKIYFKKMKEKKTKGETEKKRNNIINIKKIVGYYEYQTIKYKS